MSNRLNIGREAMLQPQRIEHAVRKIKEAGFLFVQHDKVKVWFFFKKHLVTFFPYSGWHTGKSIIDGGGIDHLLKQLDDCHK